MGEATSLAIGFDFFLSAMAMCTAMGGQGLQEGLYFAQALDDIV